VVDAVSVAVAKRVGHRYTDYEKDAGLTALAVCSGQRNKAAETLKAETGIEISPTTLKRWAEKDETERYLRIQAELGPVMRARLADLHQTLAEKSGEIEHEALELLRAKLPEMEGRDLTTAARNAAVQTGIHTEKTQLLTGQPTQIVKRDISEVARALKNKGFDIDLPEEEVEVDVMPEEVRVNEPEPDPGSIA
jgi:hypothetical protein